VLLRRDGAGCQASVRFSLDWTQHQSNLIAIRATKLLGRLPSPPILCRPFKPRLSPKAGFSFRRGGIEDEATWSWTLCDCLRSLPRSFQNEIVSVRGYGPSRSAGAKRSSPRDPPQGRAVSN
jgi:hypothetical protein